MTAKPAPKLDWSRVQFVAALKQKLLDASAAANGLRTPELITAFDRYNSKFRRLNQREREAVNNLT